MNLVIITADRMVQVDGEAINFDFSIDANIWAVHWDGSEGLVEYKDGTNPSVINNISPYQAVIDAYTVEKQRLVDVALQEEAAALAALTYADKRKAKYEELNQFEMQYDDSVNGTTTWVDTIAAIKQEFPK